MLPGEYWMMQGDKEDHRTTSYQGIRLGTGWRHHTLTTLDGTLQIIIELTSNDVCLVALLLEAIEENGLVCVLIHGKATHKATTHDEVKIKLGLGSLELTRAT